MSTVTAEQVEALRQFYHGAARAVDVALASGNRARQINAFAAFEEASHAYQTARKALRESTV
jgi:hypothetical protein